MSEYREIKQSLEFLAVASGSKDISAVRYLGKPPRRMVQHEAQIQTAVFEWARVNEHKCLELVLMYHIPNGNKRDAVTGYHLKQQGVRPGVPDICLPVAKGKYHGLYIELKAERGKIQDSQKKWIDLLSKQGYMAAVCYGLDDAVNLITYYLNLK